VSNWGWICKTEEGTIISKRVSKRKLLFLIGWSWWLVQVMASVRKLVSYQWARWGMCAYCLHHSAKDSFNTSVVFFARLVHWQSSTRGLSQIWIHIREDIRKILRIKCYSLMTCYKLLSEYGDFKFFFFPI